MEVEAATEPHPRESPDGNVNEVVSGWTIVEALVTDGDKGVKAPRKTSVMVLLVVCGENMLCVMVSFKL